MTDLVITAANVLAGSDAEIEHGTAGATITAGQAVYRDSATRKYLLADADSATAAARETRGIALHGSVLNQPLAIQKSGVITPGGTLTPGVQYYLSGANPGGICLVADVGAGEFVGLIFLATTAALATMNLKYSGVSL